MDEVDHEALEKRLREGAACVGGLFGLGLGARSLTEALDGDPAIQVFLFTAREVNHVLCQIGALTDLRDEELEDRGASPMHVPHDLVLSARRLTELTRSRE